MTELSLRESKKRQTRELIASTAARLFAQRGYENVAVTEVAKAANVAEQTVYNYFPTKERLVLDREQQLTERLADLIRSRPPGMTPAAAVREEALALVEDIKTLSPDQIRGGLGYLAVTSPAVRRLSLEMTDRLAHTIAAAITYGPDAPPAHIAGLQASAVAWVFQTITDESGKRSLNGQAASRIAAQLRPIVEDLITSLDHWL